MLSPNGPTASRVKNTSTMCQKLHSFGYVYSYIWYVNEKIIIDKAELENQLARAIKAKIAEMSEQEWRNRVISLTTPKKPKKPVQQFLDLVV